MDSHFKSEVERVPLETLPSSVSILRAQLESAEEPAPFDAKIIDLLKGISGNESKSVILNELIRMGLVGGTFFASKAFGVAVGLGAGKVGKEYATEKASEYLSRFLLTPDSVKRATAEAIGGIKNSVGKVATAVTGALPHTVTSGIQSTWKSVVQHAQELGHTIKESLPEIGGVVDSAAHQTQVLSEQGLNQSVHAVNEYVVQPTIDGTASATGYAAYLPSAAIGYLTGSALFGGSMGIYQEIKKERSFAVVGELIDTIKSGEGDRETSCRELIALFTKISNEVEGGKKDAYSFTRDQWLAFAGAVREARVFLLRKKTKPSQIIADPAVKQGNERQSSVVESIISHNELAAADRELACEILSQFDDIVGRDIDPIMKQYADKDRIGSKIQRYSGVFVKKGFSATGLPLLWKASMAVLKTGTFTARLAVPFIK